jgi:hypothetical protein
MKMTRLEWRYLQRIALDHPYYDTHKPPLSDAEARAIMEANNMMTGREFVDSIYAKLGMTRPVKDKKRLAWLRDIGEQLTIPPIRKIAIAILVVLLMTVFFAATPTGRAIAESVIQYITTLFDDGSIVVNRSNDRAVPYDVPYDGFDNGDMQIPNDITAHDIIISSFDEFKKATGKEPIVLPLPYKELYYEIDDELEYLKLSATYETSDGKITTFQIWGAEDMVSSSETGFKTYNDATICYSIEKEGKIIIQKNCEDSVFGMSSDGSYTVDELFRMLEEE